MIRKILTIILASGLLLGVTQGGLTQADDGSPILPSSENVGTALNLEWAGNQNRTSFGVHDPGDARQKLQIYKGNDGAVDYATVTFGGSGAANANIGGGGRHISSQISGLTVAQAGGGLAVAAAAVRGGSESEFVQYYGDGYRNGIPSHVDGYLPIEIPPGTAQVPAPGAILLGGIGMGFASWLRRRRFFV